jgi:transposase
VVVNTNQFKVIRQSVKKTDPHDARARALYLSKNMLPEVRMKDKEHEVGCYLGLRPRQDQSGDRDPQLGISKGGDEFLRRLLVNAAHYILGHFGPDCDLRRWGMKIAERGGRKAKKRAVAAVARKLSVLLHRLWVTGEVYDPFYRSRGVAA